MPDSPIPPTSRPRSEEFSVDQADYKSENQLSFTVVRLHDGRWQIASHNLMEASPTGNLLVQMHGEGKSFSAAWEAFVYRLYRHAQTCVNDEIAAAEGS